MRAVFCYKPVKNYKGKNIHYKPLNDSFFKLARLSVQTISRYYKTYFYTDFDTAKLFRENGLLFDEVIILNKLKMQCTSACLLKFLNYSSLNTRAGFNRVVLKSL